MTSPTKRRPLPAMLFLLALCLLAGLVWWRVINRDDGHAQAKPTCTPSKAAKTLPEPAAVTVTVLNSTTRNGIAGAARTVLIQDGFRSPDKAQNDGKDFGGTDQPVAGIAEIRYGPSGADGAKLLAYYFPGATLVKTPSTDPTVLVSLGTQYKTVSPQTTVTAALKAAGITLVPTTGVPNSAPTC
jgi:hypothetical protein